MVTVQEQVRLPVLSAIHILLIGAGYLHFNPIRQCLKDHFLPQSDQKLIISIEYHTIYTIGEKKSPRAPQQAAKMRKCQIYET